MFNLNVCVLFRRNLNCKEGTGRTASILLTTNIFFNLNHITSGCNNRETLYQIFALMLNAFIMQLSGTLDSDWSVAAFKYFCIVTTKL